MSFHAQGGRFGCFGLLICCWIFLLSSTTGRCAESAEFLLQAWQSEDGLPHQVVNSVHQDHQGFLWLGTETALVRFDGIEFKDFTSPLIGNQKTARIRALAQEDSSTLLIAPDIGGLVRLRNGTFSQHPASAALPALPIATLFTERSGEVWIGFLSGDVVRWQDGKLESFGAKEGLKGQWSSWAYDAEGRLWFANSTFLGHFSKGTLHRLQEDLGDRLCIASSRSGGIWIASNERLCRWEKGRIIESIHSPPWAGAARVRTLYEDHSGNLWIGTSARGLFRFAEGRLEAVATSHSAINQVREDFEGNIWVATHGGGLNRLRPRIFDFLNARSGLADDISYSVAEDALGRLWIGNCDGGLARLNQGRLEILTQRPDWPPLRVFSVETDAQNDTWIGTRTGLYFWKTDSETPPQRVAEDLIKDVHVVFRARNGDIWVGANPDVLVRFRNGRPESATHFTRENGFSADNVRAISESTAGGIWIGTEAGELLKFQDGKFRRFDAADGWSGGSIRTIFVDSENVTWIGTSGGGLFVLWRDRFVRITQEQGLPANAIFQLLMDNRGRMWFGSPAGLFHISREALLAVARGEEDRVHSIALGRSDGIASVSCLGGYQPTAARSSGGQLWFATRQGLLKVDTDEHTNQRPPPVVLNECIADNRPLPLIRQLKVPPGIRKLEFGFSVLSFAAPEKVQVRHRLEGFDSDWVESGSVRRVSYPKLAPGNYRLRVMACNNDGVWNERGIDLALAVLPAWWQTSWFRASTIAIAVILIAVVVRYWSHRRLRMKLVRLEQQQALEKERARIARDLHDDLGASLTQLALLAEMSADESLPAERRSRNLSQVKTGARELVRELDGILWTVNPRNDSLDKLASYLCQFSQQLFRVTNICCRFDVAEPIPAFPLSPDIRHDLFLAVKEAMNNVIKHSRATEVWLRIAVRENVFCITIEDNGRGLSATTLQNSDRNGIQNMRTRIENVGGTFEIQSQPGNGTTLRIRFPLKSEPITQSNGSRS